MNTRIAREPGFLCALEAMPDAVVVVDASGTIALVNRHVLTLFRYTAAELVGGALELLVPERLRATHALRRTGYTAASRVRPMGAGIELWGLRKDGSEFPVETSLSPLAVDGEQLTIAAIRDVGLRKQLERRLARSERLAVVSALAGGVARELNNPLTAVLANVEFTRDELAELATTTSRSVTVRLRELVDAMADATKAAERVRELTDDLCTLARVDAGSLARLDLRTVVGSAVASVDPAVISAERVRILHGEVPLVDATEANLVRVFVGLIVNAAQAMGDSGDVTVRIGTDDGGRAFADVHDTGSTIPAADIPHVFDPFYTTNGVGSGLGLAICRSIVESLRGTLAVSSEAGVGSTFRVTLPPAIEPPRLSEPARPPSGSTTAFVRSKPNDRDP